MFLFGNTILWWSAALDTFACRTRPSAYRLKKSAIRQIRKWRPLTGGQKNRVRLQGVFRGFSTPVYVLNSYVQIHGQIRDKHFSWRLETQAWDADGQNHAPSVQSACQHPSSCLWCASARESLTRIACLKLSKSIRVLDLNRFSYET